MKLKHLLPLLLSAVLSAQAYALTEREDYLVLDKPIPQEQSGKIEVLEFFGYFCVHCHHFDPLLLKLGKALPSDAYLRTEHVVWQPEMLGLARMAAAVNLSGLKYQANPAVFKAVYEQKVHLEDRAVAGKWALSQKGFDGKKLMRVYDSPEAAAASKMQKLTEQYGIDNTPTVIVGGKYRVIFNNGFDGGVHTIKELVAKVREERKRQPPAVQK
ncbi:disulfide bond formation protein DsbA [Neisseria meningitidis]|uniref:thiol:disulfide interchange protein DsbA/DsbL n=1 Tax=Neisseria meningitidis TaxID=487 RepID=UPI001BAD06CF|nr:thiol:disulfide interchange protein DsbA/DsbL [Neisseria meningitidis]MBQ5201030.1 disulfide bond formation protein DsbA [Neisseria meningitidis]